MKRIAVNRLGEAITLPARKDGGMPGRQIRDTLLAMTGEFWTIRFEKGNAECAAWKSLAAERKER